MKLLTDALEIRHLHTGFSVQFCNNANNAKLNDITNKNRIKNKLMQRRFLSNCAT